MQKRVLAGLPILAASLIFLGLWIAEKMAIPSWKSEINQYIAFKVSPADPPITLQRAIQASKPWEFKAEMSAGTFSECIYFQTNYCYRPDEILSTPPLPFPADEVWCALLNTSSSGEGSGWVVFIAKHQDLYNADWIVHENSHSQADPQMMVDLADIGCDRLMEPGQ
jgi:hypothetical protein